jgi:predicted RNase H-like nuclease (RuvC/YqgF family)
MATETQTALTPEEKIKKLTEENAKLRRQNDTLDSLNDELEEELEEIRGRNGPVR